MTGARPRVARCVLTELPVEWCAGACCQPAVPVARPEPAIEPEHAPARAPIVLRIEPHGPARPTEPRRHGWFEARYRGVCRGCGEPFTAGSLITPSDTDGWIAECCAEVDG